MHFVVEHQLDAFEIARAQQQIRRQILAILNQQNLACDAQLVQGLAIELGLGILQLEGIDNRQLAVSQLGSNCRAQRAQQLLAREGVIIAARLRSVYRVAVTPKRRANRTDTCAARALLLPQLLAGTSYFGTALG